MSELEKMIEKIHSGVSDEAWAKMPIDFASGGPGWRLIETAPKDEKMRILVWRPHEDHEHPAHHGIDRWCDVYKCWRHSRRDQQPTHWMPLPEPPKT